MLNIGYHNLAAGTIAAVVTTLEMKSPPPLRTEQNISEWKLEHWLQPDLKSYQALYRRIGEEWLWSSRLLMADATLSEIINDPKVEVYVLITPSGTGLLELDFRINNECELAFFGISSELIGTGAGRWLMSRALELAWSRPINRFWVHTCTLDHPNALSFYQRSGFIPISRQIEVMADPRLTGVLPKTAAPQIPCLTNKS
ncbi:GNAT family N-acetyltransferase [Entomomonas asaccharolytica]|uniref:GNAT family N-acetyltransferase n=1 Tax=Entomomonas asaccharolytica TaxID=2785331 RepID=A0A974NFE8_9GAMM|nr:GNAT family N-acetyltransferase [Entomomonas asaccharolytica]QQP85570.1 GNAT family N-acetyltransferase [Entomomonas asaccharolytica]